MGKTPILRICMLLPFPYFGYGASGGPEWRLDPQMEMCFYLARMGHEVHCVAVLNEERPLENRLFGARLHAVRPRRSGSRLAGPWLRLANIRAKARLALKVIREENCNLVFARSEDIFDGLVGVYLQRTSRIPLVYELVNPLRMGREVSRMEGGRPAVLSFLAGKVSELLRVYAMKHAELVLPTTRWFDDEIVRAGIPAAKLLPYPNGVDTEMFHDHCGTERRDGFQKVVYVGSLARSRNLVILINALARVKRVRENVRLLLVGDGGDMMYLKRLARSLGLERDVIFTGRVPPADVPGLIAGAEIAVSAVPPYSFYRVSSPVKLFEYMAMSKPVLANEEIFEHREVLKESGGGLAVPFTADAFAAAIVSLLDNPGLAREMGRRGCRWVRQNRSYDLMARRMEREYLALTPRNIKIPAGDLSQVVESREKLW